MTKSSLLICCYVVSVKLTVKISSIFVAFLKNMNFKQAKIFILKVKSKLVHDKSTLASSLNLFFISFWKHTHFTRIVHLVLIGATSVDLWIHPLFLILYLPRLILIYIKRTYSHLCNIDYRGAIMNFSQTRPRVI